jgi:5'-phosphate synthase pdxT subunit
VEVGVLALQGDVREHLRSLGECGAIARPVKTAADIAAIDALVIPGGESTTISKLARSFGLFDLISERIHSGMPVYGSCAGMILLADNVLDAIDGQESFGGLDATVRRNAFGRQVDSFEMDLTITGLTEPAFRAVFIRAPWVEKVGANVEVLAKVDGHPVAVRQGNIFATSFHPELTGDNRVHRYFVNVVCAVVQSGRI